MRNLRLGTKIFSGFALVIVIFSLVAAYQIFSIQELGELERLGTERSKDALDVNEVLSRVSEVYPVIADGIINRDIEETLAGFAAAKEQAKKDMALVHELVDTEEERASANAFETSYREYLKLFEDELIPILKKEESIDKRMKDSLSVMQIAVRVGDFRSLVAKAVVNRDWSEGGEEFAGIRNTAADDIAEVQRSADTEKEKALAIDFERNYLKALGLFENGLLPLLRERSPENHSEIVRLYSEFNAAANSLSAAIQGISGSLEDETRGVSADENRIREIDGEIDQIRRKVFTPLRRIVASLGEEQSEAAEHFDVVRSSTEYLSTGIALVGVLVGLLISLFLTRAITGPINRVITGLNEGADQVSSASGQVASAGQSLAQGASEQAASIEECSASLEEIASMTKLNAEHAGSANQLMNQTRDTVGRANDSLNTLTRSMEDISRASDETSKIIKTIDEIAFQTNLLALNAAVEAARAGEAGAGFSVVAEEVRNLAMRAAEAAGNTSNLISGTVKAVTDGSAVVRQTNEAFAGVSDSAQKAGDLVSEISAASKEQAQSVEQISNAVSDMDKITQRNAANAEESASASEEMNAQAHQLKEFVAELARLVGGKGGGGGERGGGRKKTGAAGIEPAEEESGYRRALKGATARLVPPKRKEIRRKGGTPSQNPQKFLKEF